jgi:hypothetical protein
VVGRQCAVKTGARAPGYFGRRDYRIGFSGISGDSNPPPPMT